MATFDPSSTHSTYFGSRDDGNDAHFSTGYAPYDFNSIMHYARHSGANKPGLPAFDTLPGGAYNAMVGQVESLSFIIFRCFITLIQLSPGSFDKSLNGE